jgi:hypothetical protein
VRASKKRRGSKIHNALIKKRASLDWCLNSSKMTEKNISWNT